MTRSLFAALLGLSLAATLAAPAHAQTSRRGYLGAGDARLTSGEYYDRYTYVVPRGASTFTVAQSSDDFDSYLIVIAPTGEQFDDDDSGGGLDAFVGIDNPTPGTWIVQATSYSTGANGNYVVSMSHGGGGYRGGGSTATEDEVWTRTGYLGAGDARLTSGEYYDVHTYDVHPGTSEITVVQSATDFDSYLILIAPSGEQFDDDDSGDGLDARISIRNPEPGTWQIRATSYSSGARGEYAVAVGHRH